MILIFGGTTEGRRAIKVCEEAAKPFFYSTKGDTQKVDIVNGTHIVGALDSLEIVRLCEENNIKLIVNTSHPFAENLHQNIAIAAQQLNIPVLRLERNYPDIEEDLLWFNTYQEAVMYLEQNNIDNLLALTGVNTISKLKSYWKNHSCWFRILDREDSRQIVQNEEFPTDKILYYKKNSDEYELFRTLKPAAIMTKESGESGGFEEKVKAASKLNIPILVVKRPQLSSTFISVYGENGLRKQIEKLLPCFFDLKTGYTTGTCATAATKAAFSTLLTDEILSEISITLPDGEWVKIPIHSTIIDEKSVQCSVIKDAGDDPDITNGHEIVATVAMNLNHKGVAFLQGKGVGKVTLPGLDSAIGEPSINKTPRMMMKREVYKIMRHYQDRLPNGLKTGVDITISVPDGEALTLRTFNPKLGIIGGISIIGTSGIVKPFSSEAFVASIRREVQVAKALGCNHLVINSGAKSEKYVKQIYSGLSSQAFIHYGNFIGETIKVASELKLSKLTLGIMLGKAVKLAEGSLDTHSKKVVMNIDFLKKVALEAKCSIKTIEAITDLTMARQLWELIPEEENVFFSLIRKKCEEVCSPLFESGDIEVLLIDENGNIIR